MRLGRVLAVGIGVLVLQGCGFSEVRARAQLAVDAYYRGYASGSVEEALASYADEFFKVTPREEWRRELIKLKATAGTLESYELTSSWVSNQVGTNAGTYATLVYAVVYEKAQTVETFTVSAPSSGAPRIVAHSFEFQGAAPVPESEEPIRT